MINTERLNELEKWMKVASPTGMNRIALELIEEIRRLHKIIEDWEHYEGKEKCGNIKEMKNSRGESE